MQIQQISEKDAHNWDSFVNLANNGTIFHSLKFQKYHSTKKIPFHNLAFYDHQELVAILPGMLNEDGFTSPAGASYGSFITRDISFSHYESVIETFLKYANNMSIKKIVLTPSPTIYSHAPNDIEEFLLIYKGFTVKNRLISNALDLRLLNDDFISNFTPMHRRSVKKAQSLHVAIKISDDFKTFYAMLLENKKKFSAKPTHKLAEILRLKKLFPDNILLFMAYNKTGQPIASVLLFLTNTHTALAFYICHYYSYQEYRGVNYLFYHIITWLKEHKFQWLDLGVSMDTLSINPMEPSRSLISFKEGVGSHGVLRRTYEWKK